MITIDATGATSGIDFEEFVRGGFISDATGGGFPVFDNSASFSGEEMFMAYGSDATSKYVLAHGSLEYAFSTHTVAGTINTIEFGTLGSGSYDSDGYYTGGNVELRITGLDLYNAVPTSPAEEADIEANGPVHNFAVAYMGGANASEERLDKFGDGLDSEAQHFKGSAHADIYTGTVFDDVIEGNGGNDTLGGGGGNDHIDGGDGVDTAVFDDVQSAYSIKKFAGGLVTVSIGEDTATLRNVEKLKFGDGTVDVADLDEVERITIDARGSDGIDFNTYLADYFAKLQLNGTSSYHGGTEDAPYGYLNGDQVSFKYRLVDDVSGPFTNVVILEGDEIAYDAIHYPGQGHPHGSVSGTIDTLIFGTIVGDEPASGAALYTGYDAELVISGLGIHDEPGAGGSSSPNLVPILYYGIRSGDFEAIEAVLAGYAQEFLGSDGDDGFTGGDFDDLIFGGLGSDSLGGGAGSDVVKGGDGDDLISGGSDADQLFGNAGKDKLYGDGGNDFLIGGKEKDKLFGGEGADTFVFVKKGDSGVKKALRDVIRDFSQDDGDKIDLSFGDGLSFLGKKGFSGDGDEVRYGTKGGTTVVKVDLDGDKSPDMKIDLVGKIALAEGDFIL